MDILHQDCIAASNDSAYVNYSIEQRFGKAANEDYLSPVTKKWVDDNKSLINTTSPTGGFYSTRSVTALLSTTFHNTAFQVNQQFNDFTDISANSNSISFNTDATLLLDLDFSFGGVMPAGSTGNQIELDVAIDSGSGPVRVLGPFYETYSKTIYNFSNVSVRVSGIVNALNGDTLYVRVRCVSNLPGAYNIYLGQESCFTFRKLV